MKKTLAILITALLFFAVAVGGASAAAPAGFTAPNEIFTYQRVDPAKTQIVVSRTGNIDALSLCNAFEEKNPDVQIVYQDITGGNTDYKPLIEWISRGYLPDVVISAASFFNAELTKRCFRMLSADPILQNYETAALQRTATDYEIYWLPGPSNISAMMYNKTLFAQYGWQVPATFDEFVALCDRITLDTGGAVEPWNPNAKYDMELLTVMEAFTYEELLGGAENRAWYNALLEGRETLTGHMEPYTEALQTLIDHNILRPEHFTYSATTRGKEFAAGKIAMINVNLYDVKSDQYTFGCFPFPTTKGQVGYLCDSYSCYVGLPLKEQTEKQADAIERFIAFFSSPEGQAAYIKDGLKISNVKSVPLNQTAGEMSTLQPAVDAGHMFAVMDFAGPQGGRSYYLHQIAMSMALEGQSGEACLAAADAGGVSNAVAVAAPQPVADIAAVPEDMTVLETSFFMADAYRAVAGADIGLITHNEAYRGNMMRFFKGGVTRGMLSVFKPRSFANGSTLVKCVMTGRQLADALNHPVAEGSAVSGSYAYSGLQCKLAPWRAPGERVLSATMADGSAIEPDRRYTVAFWQGTVAEEYITETLESYAGTWEEIMLQYLAKTPVIAPADAQRIELVWD